jgi:hypothetical protein
MKTELVRPDPCPRCGAAPGHVGECLQERLAAAEAARKSFGPNPDHVAVPEMRRSIHRSHRGEGFNNID